MRHVIIWSKIQVIRDPFILLSMYLPICLSTYLSINLSIYLPVYLSMYVPVFMYRRTAVYGLPVSWRLSPGMDGGPVVHAHALANVRRIRSGRFCSLKYVLETLRLIYVFLLKKKLFFLVKIKLVYI